MRKVSASNGTHVPEPSLAASQSEREERIPHSQPNGFAKPFLTDMPISEEVVFSCLVVALWLPERVSGGYEKVLIPDTYVCGTFSIDRKLYSNIHRMSLSLSFPVQSPENISSTSRFFVFCSSKTFSSIVPRTMSFWTKTVRVCPIRWARSVA